MGIRRLLFAGAAGFIIFGIAPTTSFARDMVFTSWGGTTEDAQKKAWVEPFQKATGLTVKLDGPTDYGKLKAMVDSGNVEWDVVDVEGDFAVAAAKQGLLEPLDLTAINKGELDPDTASPGSAARAAWNRSSNIRGRSRFGFALRMIRSPIRS